MTCICVFPASSPSFTCAGELSVCAAELWDGLEPAVLWLVGDFNQTNYFHWQWHLYVHVMVRLGSPQLKSPCRRAFNFAPAASLGLMRRH